MKFPIDNIPGVSPNAARAMPRKAGSSPTDIVDVRAFCLVVDLGSITAAASALGESKGSVSKRISRLERTLGITLVRRSPRLVEPTELGAAYRVNVARALELFDDATRSLTHSAELPSGVLRIMVPDLLGVTRIGHLVHDFIERNPAVSVEVMVTEKRTLDFDADHIDIALQLSLGGLPDSALIARKLFNLDASFVAAPRYLALHPPPRTPQELNDHRLLLPMQSGGLRGPLVLPLTRRQAPHDKTEVRLEGVIRSNNGTLLRQAALAGGGITVTPRLADPEIAEGRLVEVLPDYVLRGAAVYVVHPPMQFIPPKVRAFRDFVIAELSGGDNA